MSGPADPADLDGTAARLAAALDRLLALADRPPAPPPAAETAAAAAQGDLEDHTGTVVRTLDRLIGELRRALDRPR